MLCLLQKPQTSPGKYPTHYKIQKFVGTLLLLLIEC